MRIYVGNFPYDTSDEQLKNMFEKVGVPESVSVVVDRDTGRSKGFGFIEFSDPTQARQALSLNGTDFGGRPLTVNEAKPRAERSGSGYNGRPRY